MVRTARRPVPLCLCACVCVCVCLYRLLVYPVTLTSAFGLSAQYTPPGYCLQGMRTASSRGALMSCRQLSSTSQQLTLTQRAQPLSLSLPQPPSMSLSLSFCFSHVHSYRSVSARCPLPFAMLCDFSTISVFARKRRELFLWPHTQKPRSYRHAAISRGRGR